MLPIMRNRRPKSSVSGSRSSTGWMPVTLGLYSASTSATSTPCSARYALNRAAGVVDLPEHGLVTEIGGPFLPRRLERGQPGGVHVRVDERQAVQHLGSPPRQRRLPRLRQVHG